MKLTILEVGPLQANCVLLSEEASGQALVIAPGDEPERILEALEGLQVRFIVCTHGHFDHVGAVPELKEATGAPLALHEAEVQLYQAALDMAAFWGYKLQPLPPPDVLLKEADVLEAGSLRFRVLHTPGHSPGGICLLGHDLLISGDTLFAGSVGRTDFEGGDMEALRRSVARLASLPPHTRVIPGHGPPSTIAEERENNPFMEDL